MHYRKSKIPALMSEVPPFGPLDLYQASQNPTADPRNAQFWKGPLLFSALVQEPRKHRVSIYISTGLGFKVYSLGFRVYLLHW